MALVLPSASHLLLGGFGEQGCEVGGVSLVLGRQELGVEPSPWGGQSDPLLPSTECRPFPTVSRGSLLGTEPVGPLRGSWARQEDGPSEG